MIGEVCMGGDFDDFDFGGKELASKSVSLNNQTDLEEQTAKTHAHSYAVISKQALDDKAEGDILLMNAGKACTHNPITTDQVEEAVDRNHFHAATNKVQSKLSSTHEVTPFSIIQEGVAGLKEVTRIGHEGLEKKATGDADKATEDAKKIWPMLKRVNLRLT